MIRTIYIYIRTIYTSTLVKSKCIFKPIPRGWYLSCRLSQRKVPSGKPDRTTWLPFGRWEFRNFSVSVALEYSCSGVVISGTGSIRLWVKETENALVDYKDRCTRIQNTCPWSHPTPPLGWLFVPSAKYSWLPDSLVVGWAMWLVCLWVMSRSDIRHV